MCALFVAVFVLLAGSSHAQSSVTLQWDLNTEADLEGYVVEVGKVPGAPDRRIDVGRATTCVVATIAEQRQYAWVRAYNTAGLLSGPSNVVEISAAPAAEASPRNPLDADDDGMADAWEAQYGVTSPGEDDDGDGLSNLAEHERQTDPTLPKRELLPDGASGFYDQRLALANPNSTRASGTVILRLPGGERRVPFTVEPLARATIDVDQVLGATAPAAFASVVEVDRGGVVVERTVRWGRAAGKELIAGHTGRAVPAPSSQWYFAEGSTRGFRTFFILANESASSAAVVFQFVREDGAKVTRSYRLAARARLTVEANAITELANTSFWTVVFSTVPIAAERAMYFDRGTGTWIGGQLTAGMRASSRTWYFGEGQTGSGFQSIVSLANPGRGDVSATLTWLRPALPPVTEVRVVPAGRRITVSAAGVPGLSATPFALAVQANAPIFAERAVHWPGTADTWHEAHASAGEPLLGKRWLFADGEIGGQQKFATSVSVANPHSSTVTLTMTLLREAGGKPITKRYTVGARSRATLPATGLGLGSGERFGIVIDSSLPVVVERSMYWTAEGKANRGGTCEAGFRVR